MEAKLEKDFTYKKVETDISEVKKMLKKADSLFADICKKYIGKEPGIHERMISDDLLLLLIERWPGIMMDIKSKLDEQLHLQMDWLSMHYDNVRHKVEQAMTEEDASKLHKKMTLEWEKDVENDSFMDKAKFLYATKIRGE